jgi:hypothetical protein
VSNIKCGMQRTSQNLKEDVVKNYFGVRAQPLVSIEPEHIIIDELHLLLRICDKDLRQVGGFLWVHCIPQPIKLTAT